MTVSSRMTVIIAKSKTSLPTRAIDVRPVIDVSVHGEINRTNIDVSSQVSNSVAVVVDSEAAASRGVIFKSPL